MNLQCIRTLNETSGTRRSRPLKAKIFKSLVYITDQSNRSCDRWDHATIDVILDLWDAIAQQADFFSASLK